jgi:ADP-ribose pyrophosphatase YjhB (NUDIX family)
MKIIGKLIYLFSFPFILLIIRNSKRVYAAIIFENRILVTKNFLGFHNAWRLPGGGLKKGEPEIQGLIREVQEEVGILITADNLSLIISEKKHRKNFFYSVYLCNLEQLPAIKIDNKEILEAKFIAINELISSSNLSESTESVVKYLMSD